MELQILDFIQTLRTPFLDAVNIGLSRLGNNGLIEVALAAVLLLFPKTRRYGIIVAAALIFDFLLCNLLLKPLIARIRPYDVNTAVQLIAEKPGDYSFPSGHTALAMAAASALLFAGSKRLGIPMLLLAVLIGLSRMYLYMHYPTDVLGGAVVGVACGWTGWHVVTQVPETVRKVKSR